MRLRHCILFLMILTITSMLYISCDKENTQYYYSPSLGVKFIPQVSYSRYVSGDNSMLLHYGQNPDYTIFKVHDNGTLDSAKFNCSGDLRYSINPQTNDIFVYSCVMYGDMDYFHFIRFDANDLNKSFVSPISDMPKNHCFRGFASLKNGGAILLTEYMEYDEYYVLIKSQLYYLTVFEPDGKIQRTFEFNPQIKNLNEIMSINKFNNLFVVRYSTNGGNEYMTAFYDENFNLINHCIMQGSGDIYFFDDHIYAVATYSKEMDGNNNLHSIVKFDNKGNVVSKSDEMFCPSIEGFTLAGDKLVMVGHSRQKDKLEVKETYEGKMFLIDKENLADIDTVVMKYNNAIPFAVFADKDFGYNLFLTRKFDYSVAQIRDQNYPNIYIYHFDDLHNLQIDD